MAVQIDDSDILAELTADINAAWPNRKIYESTPRLSATYADLPRVFIRVGEVPFTADGAAIRQVVAEITYEITYQGALKDIPANTTLYKHKKNLLNALLARLTDETTYAGHRWFRDGLAADFGDPDTAENSEPVYHVSLRFPVNKDINVR